MAVEKKNDRLLDIIGQKHRGRNVLEHSFHFNNEEEFPALPIDIGKKSDIHLKNEEELPPLCVTNDMGKKLTTHLKNEEEFPALGTP